MSALYSPAADFSLNRWDIQDHLLFQMYATTKTCISVLLHACCFNKPSGTSSTS